MHIQRIFVSIKLEEWWRMRSFILGSYVFTILLTLLGCSAKVDRQQEFLIIAHRGASAYAPEHTIPAYELALQQNADYLEIDLQMTADGVLVSMHDESVNRTTNGDGAVQLYSLSEIKKLDAGTWFNEEFPDLGKKEYEGITVPTLEEIIEHFGTEVSYYIETKSPSVYPGMEEELLRVLSRFDLVAERDEDSKVIIQSFSSDSLKLIHELAPTIPLIQLLSNRSNHKLTDEDFEEIKEYAAGIGPSHKKMNKDFVKNAREAGLEVHPYTINDAKELRKYLNWGITGAFTNHPDVAYETCCLAEGD